MIDKMIYRYSRSDGNITVSTEKPNTEYTVLHRLISEKGKILYKNNIETPAIDTDDVTGWSEKDDSNTISATEVTS